MDTMKFQAEFAKLLKTNVDESLTLITGMFVGLTLEIMRRKGFDPSGDVKIEGMGNRNITIHKLEK